jgi:hypothetical protein
MVAGGDKLSVPADPPQFTNAPWWQLNVVGYDVLLSASNTGYITVAQLKTTFMNQLGLTGDQQFLFRIRKVRCWHQIGTSYRSALGIEPYDLGRNIIRSEIVDFCGRNTYSRVGYEWPLADQSIALYTGTDGGQNVVLWECKTDAPANSYLVWYFDILWRFNTFTVPGADSSFVGSFPLPPANESSGPGDAVGFSIMRDNPDIKDREGYVVCDRYPPLV